MKSLIVVFACLLIVPLIAEDMFHAEIFAENDPGKLVYTHSNTISQKGDSSIIDHFYFTPDGEKYVRDRVILVKNEPIYNSVDFYQIGEYSSLSKKGDEVILKYERDGVKKEVSRKLHTPLVFAPIQQSAIRENLKNLLNGGSANFYIFASEVSRLVKMKVVLIENSQYERKNCVVLQMKPNNIFIDWFVDEVYYVVDKSSGRIMEMHGFSTLRQKINGEWEYQDMDFYYTYK